MNWAMFNWVGYLSIGLWLCMPLLWLLHERLRPRRWLGHIALGVGVVALVLATINSRTHVNRIAVDRSDQIEQQMTEQERIRRAAEEQRAGEAAQIRFAEDASGDQLDLAGLDDADLKYFEATTEGEEPAWRQQKQQRSTDDETDADLEAMIGGTTEREGMTSEAMPEEPATEPILMSDRDHALANRLDAGNLAVIRWLLVVGLAYLVFDYVRRLNIENEAYCPLPLPSRWTDALTRREAIEIRRSASRAALIDDLKEYVRRGEPFIYLTDDREAASAIPERLPRLPKGMWPIDVIRMDQSSRLTDEFVFETLWFARDCVVVESAERADTMLQSFVDLLMDRRQTRARTKQTVHIVWDRDAAVSDAMQKRLTQLGQATGFRLIIRSRTD